MALSRAYFILNTKFYIPQLKALIKIMLVNQNPSFLIFIFFSCFFFNAA